MRGVAVLACGAGFMAAPALARCGKDCKTLIRTEFKSCKAASAYPVVSASAWMQ